MPSHRPSYTAIKISKGILILAQDPSAKDLLPKGAAQWTERLLIAAGIVKRWELSMMRQVWFRNFAAFIERHTMPGQSVYLALRKRFFDDEVRDAIGSGATQVLAIGAGFDTLCARLAGEHPAALALHLWIALAASSLPTPVSPRIRTDASVGATTSILLYSFCMIWLCPTIP